MKIASSIWRGGALADPFTYDANGNRVRRGNRRIYKYDKADRLVTFKGQGHRADYAYDYTGRRVRKIEKSKPARAQTSDAPPPIVLPILGRAKTRHFSDLFEVTISGRSHRQTKHYVIGGVLVASKESDVPPSASYADAGPVQGPVDMMADLGGSGRPILRVLLGAGSQTACLAGIGFLALGFVVRTPRRRRLGVVPVRVGPTLTLVAVVTIGTLPWAIVLSPRPAEASTVNIRHFHHDHLGSTQVITNDMGGIVMQIRYTAWGLVRGRFDASNHGFAAVAPNDRYEFTGYETDVGSDLEYAGARFYDPDVGMFLTHDPARQFANHTHTGRGIQSTAQIRMAPSSASTTPSSGRPSLSALR